MPGRHFDFTNFATKKTLVNGDPDLNLHSKKSLLENDIWMMGDPPLASTVYDKIFACQSAQNLFVPHLPRVMGAS